MRDDTSQREGLKAASIRFLGNVKVNFRTKKYPSYLHTDSHSYRYDLGSDLSRYSTSTRL
jgi:hypothetical protein